MLNLIENVSKFNKDNKKEDKENINKSILIGLERMSDYDYEEAVDWITVKYKDKFYTGEIVYKENTRRKQEVLSTMQDASPEEIRKELLDNNIIITTLGDIYVSDEDGEDIGEDLDLTDEELMEVRELIDKEYQKNA